MSTTIEFANPTYKVSLETDDSDSNAFDTAKAIANEYLMVHSTSPILKVEVKLLAPPNDTWHRHTITTPSGPEWKEDIQKDAVPPFDISDFLHIFNVTGQWSLAHVKSLRPVRDLIEMAIFMGLISLEFEIL